MQIQCFVSEENVMYIININSGCQIEQT